MVTLPLWPAAGTTVSVRLFPPPPKARLEFGTSVGFEELAVKTRLVAAVSGSLIAKAIGPTGVPTVVAWSGIVLIVGGAPRTTVVTVRFHPVLIAPLSPDPSSTT